MVNDYWLWWAVSVTANIVSIATDGEMKPISWFLAGGQSMFFIMATITEQPTWAQKSTST